MILLCAAHGQPVLHVACGPGSGAICTDMPPPDGSNVQVAALTARPR